MKNLELLSCDISDFELKESVFTLTRGLTEHI